MSDNYIDVLAVLPYSELASLIQNIQSDYPTIHIHCVIGNLETGISAAKQAIQEKTYDLILSRGGTAEQLREVFNNIPVIEIPINFEDLFFAITLAKNYQKDFAIVSFPALTDQAKTLCRLTKDHFRIESIHSQKDAEYILMQLKNEGYSMIVGDVITAQIARRYNLNIVLITSSENSIRGALNNISHLLPMKIKMNHFIKYKTLKKKQPTILGFRRELPVEKHTFHNPLGSFNSIGIIQKEIILHAASKQPTVIIGESGTGKDAAATAIYRQDKLHHHGFFTIDCQIISDRDLKLIFDQPTSPLYDENATFYFKNVQSLSYFQIAYLFEQITDARLQKRHKLIFSIVQSTNNTDFIKKIVKIFLPQINALLLVTQPVRCRKEEMKSIVTLYISNINTRYGTTVVGFEKDAERLFLQFSWPGNIPQLKRVLTEIVLSAKKPYITIEETEFAIQNEIFEMPQNFSYNINLNRSLKEINQEIVQLVLKEEKMNQSKTADRLKISRTTLWRMLKNTKNE